ncbi:CHASE domain-containing protein [Pseudoalteromonas denitrificans]|uniref:PAS domain S-box-containing protein n=1 Tax=Pseudoalteromonas denitrificans DSM 6059 TaxID=1123010 RepID=A0A1I1PQR7_9GAMM|nr:CHASE domain-containing protein [Pseudoalteromonas denitrificans]SFD12159.1 PAS domain S-box-containing protein [Pseudoalteromonas denitrificans DSM 6059]
MGEKQKSNTNSLTRLHWYHWLIVIASLALTITAWYVTSAQIKQKTQLQFNAEAKQIIQLVKERMAKYEDGLLGGVAAIHGLDNGTNIHHWRIFSSSLSIAQRYPGINGIGVIHYVAPDKLDDYLTKEKLDRPNYHIHPAHNKNEFWPITYIEPVSVNKKAVGLDMAHENNRLTAAKKARDTGTTQITAPIILVQDEKRTPGFLFYAPYYQEVLVPKSVLARKNKFIGNVYAPFIMEKLMEGTLLNQNRLVNFKISDENSELYNELYLGSEGYDAKPLFSNQTSVDMYGRKWLFTIQTTQLFREQYQNNQPILILIGGVIIDSMLLGLFLVLARSNKQAIRLAQQMSLDFKLSEQRLHLTINSMMDGLLTVANNNIILSVNKMAENIFGLDSEDIIGKDINLFICVINSHVPINNLKVFLPKQNSNLKIEHEVLGHKKPNISFPMEISVGELIDCDEEIYTVIVRDISERTIEE